MNNHDFFISIYNDVKNNKLRLETENDKNILTEPKKELKNKPIPMYYPIFLHINNQIKIVFPSYIELKTKILKTLYYILNLVKKW